MINDTYSNFNLNDEIAEILIKEVFPKLTFKEFLTFGLLSKSTQLLTGNPSVLADIIYKIATFNPNDWFNQLGLLVKEEDAKRDFPKNIVQIFMGPCPYFSEKKFWQTHSIVWIPDNMSLKKYDHLIRKIPLRELKLLISELFCHPSDYESLTSKGKWMVMLNSISEIKNEDYRIPYALESAICVSATFFKFKTKMFNNNFGRCQERVFNWQMLIGFDVFGLRLTHEEEGITQKIGSAWIRNL